MKVCKKCSQTLPKNCFYPNRATCKTCFFSQVKEYQTKVAPDKRRAYQKKSSQRDYQENKDLILERNHKWRDQNKEWVAAYNKQYRELYPDVLAFQARLYEQVKKQACPVWAKQDKIREIYKQARFLTKKTGVLYTVDHIIPLRGKTVCGLHVENNLQILTKSENSRKRNFHEDSSAIGLSDHKDQQSW
jgi:hypothetical protein